MAVDEARGKREGQSGRTQAKNASLCSPAICDGAEDIRFHMADAEERYRTRVDLPSQKSVGNIHAVRNHTACTSCGASLERPKLHDLDVGML
jgi:hypothetical protein